MPRRYVRRLTGHIRRYCDSADSRSPHGRWAGCGGVGRRSSHSPSTAPPAPPALDAWALLLVAPFGLVRDPLLPLPISFGHG